MTDPREQLADIIREQRESPNLISETVIAILTDNVVDGTPVTSATIGPLMAAHADALEELAGSGDQ